MKKIFEQPESLKLEVLEKLSALITAGFGLVAALAWNDAIKAMFNKFFPAPTGNLVASIVYASFITIVVVAVTMQFGRAVSKARKHINKTN
ncbi:MAG: DUF5654 family protein [Patescibacteria group bacterium]